LYVASRFGCKPYLLGFTSADLKSLQLSAN
jgi:hypothetical protein